ncbi:MAG: sigma-70 family RNA polymerase sigma factor [Phycisphaerales bacterium]|nr:MAG: sigma-70 family RNA polymerase sigma factor [Phycisphaerales bacterium]
MTHPGNIRSELHRRVDYELICACRSGDEEAWRELVSRYGRLVFSIPRRYGLSPQASEDVFQEVFAILVRQLPTIRNPTGLPKWLITTTHRVSCRISKQGRTESTHVADTVDPHGPPPEEISRWERQQLVRECLRRLGGRCEELLTALYMGRGQVGYEEISRSLDMPIGSIGPTRARCLQKLLEIMEDYGSEQSL